MTKNNTELFVKYCKTKKTILTAIYSGVIESGSCAPSIGFGSDERLLLYPDGSTAGCRRIISAGDCGVA